MIRLYCETSLPPSLPPVPIIRGSIQLYPSITTPPHSPAPFWNTTYADANQLYKTFVGNAGCDEGETKEERRACMTSLPLEGKEEHA